MDSYDFVDTVGSEKANAIARYRMFTNLSKSLQFIEVLFAVVLISWSSTRLPIVFRFSGEYLVQFSSYFMNQHVVFLLGNLIVVLCYFLSRRSESGNDSAASGTFHGDRKFNAPTAKPVVEPPIATVTVTESQNRSQNRMIRNEEEAMVIKSESEVVMAETAIKQAVKQMERFQRTQSEKLKSEISTKSRRELRRSVTETERRRNGGELTTTSAAATTSFQAVERLSNEEFRVAVEAFISKQQSFLKQQSMVDNGS